MRLSCLSRRSVIFFPNPSIRISAIMAIPKKWFTCTPKRFPGDHTFFARDSGLLCKGFQEIGVECKAIMPGPDMPNDQTEDLIRTDYANLEDPEWWRTLGGDGVVFYGWGSGKYVRIVKAIKLAGLKLVSHLDTAGMLGVLNGFFDFSKTLWTVSKGEASGTLTTYTRFAARLAYGTTVGLIKNDFTRARHLKQADWIGAITPIALERIQKVCRTYGGEALAEKVKLIPHPNSLFMRYDPRVPKEPLVVATGRWDDDRVKGTDLLMATVAALVAKSPDTKVEIFGTIPPFMEDWHRGLPQTMGERIHLLGVVRNEILAMALQRASISLCTSLRESYHIASAEALCCGCSIVGPDVSEIPSMKWFTEPNSGRLAARNAEAMTQALLEELQAWHDGARDANGISEIWAGRLQAPRVAELILRTCGHRI